MNLLAVHETRIPRQLIQIDFFVCDIVSEKRTIDFGEEKKNSGVVK